MRLGLDMFRKKSSEVTVDALSIHYMSTLLLSQEPSIQSGGLKGATHFPSCHGVRSMCHGPLGGLGGEGEVELTLLWA